MKEYLKRKDFLKKARISKSKFYRDRESLIKRYENYNKPIFKKIGKEIRINNILLQEYVDDYWIMLKSKSNKQQDIINIYKDPSRIENHLQKFNWKIFATVSPKFDWNNKQCRSEMSSLFDLLNKKFKDVKLFWTSESFTNRTGNHNHFLIDFEGSENYKKIKELITKYFEGNMIDVQKYDETKLGTFYVSKGLNGINWDIYLSLESTPKNFNKI